jgi:hypothetical protein
MLLRKLPNFLRNIGQVVISCPKSSTKLAKICLLLDDATRRFSTLPDAARRYSTLLDAARRCSTLLDAARRYSTLLDATRWHRVDATRRYSDATSMLLEATLKLLRRYSDATAYALLQRYSYAILKLHVQPKNARKSSRLKLLFVIVTTQNLQNSQDISIIFQV